VAHIIYTHILLLFNSHLGIGDSDQPLLSQTHTYQDIVSQLQFSAEFVAIRYFSLNIYIGSYFLCSDFLHTNRQTGECKFEIFILHCEWGGVGGERTLHSLGSIYETMRRLGLGGPAADHQKQISLYIRHMTIHDACIVVTAVISFWIGDFLFLFSHFFGIFHRKDLILDHYDIQI